MVDNTEKFVKEFTVQGLEQQTNEFYEEVAKASLIPG